jgi:hypothetical protein
MTETTKQRTERLLSMSSAELVMHVQDLTLENERYRAALHSIAANRCCGSCQEAKLVALDALEE